MIREYRGWSVKGKKWLYGDIYTGALDMPGCETWKVILPTGSVVPYVEDCFYCEFHYVDPKSIGQWTGFKDKNGTKIFEGDIVTFSYLDISSNAKIIFENGCYKITCKYGIEPITHCNDVGVIGNIYENPELLEKK